MALRRVWHDHGLTIVRGVLGVIFTAPAFFMQPGLKQDLFAGGGITFIAVAFNDTLAGWLREVNKPED